MKRIVVSSAFILLSLEVFSQTSEQKTVVSGAELQTGKQPEKTSGTSKQAIVFTENPEQIQAKKEAAGEKKQEATKGEFTPAPSVIPPEKSAEKKDSPK